ncbi:MAG: histidine kinase N-terminal 7TM domain-containing protein [Acetatifactor sp.]
MYYLACFIISLLIFLWATAINGNMKTNQILLIVITVIGNGGYYALACSNCLEMAVLANKLTYLIGIFAPMLIFFNICEVCKIKIRHFLIIILYTVQILLYLGVCTIGISDLFYKTVEFHTGNGSSFLTKTYGPVHSIYIVTVFLYLAMSIVVSFYSFNKKNKVSYKNVDILIFTSILIVGTYLLERVLHLKMEFMPFVFTIGLVAILVPVTKISRYSVEENSEIIRSKMEGTAYIVFSRKLHYMGCNEYAGILFPELLEWELEKKIPGNGGRFNTFLRQTFLKFVEAKQEQPMKGKPFSIKDRNFHYVVKNYYNGNKHLGYVIELIDVTDFTNASM